jgi:hypothetical protein
MRQYLGSLQFLQRIMWGKLPILSAQACNYTFCARALFFFFLIHHDLACRSLSKIYLHTIRKPPYMFRSPMTDVSGLGVFSRRI